MFDRVISIRIDVRMTEVVEIFGLDTVDQLVRIVALALPALMLLTLLALLLRARKRARSTRTPQPLQALDPVSLSSPDIAPITRAPDVSRSAAPMPEEQAALGLIGQQDQRPAAIRPPSEDTGQSIEALEIQLKEAMIAAPQSTLAPLFLDMARQHQAAGDYSAYLAALRSAAGLAAQHGPRSAHAQARLELAEAAFNAGDLIGACEQWQMARDALLYDGQKEAHARVEKKMRDNGCPTDWVLTDF